MTITLSVTGASPDGGVSPSSIIVREEGVSIGRSGSCDVVVQDATRTVSGQHARLALEDGELRLFDSSTNGTFVNGSERRIARGTSMPLSDGDRFRLGKYEFEVHVAAAAQPSSPPANDITALNPELSPSASPAPDPATLPPPTDSRTSPTRLERPSGSARTRKWLDPAAFTQGFLRGAGLDDISLARMDSGQLGERFGATLRDSLATVMLVLRGRAEVKNEFRLGGTQVMARDNNALKFSIDGTEALSRLFGEFQDAYLDAGKSLQQAQQDISDHELASLYATSVALVEMISHFDPRQLEQDIVQDGDIPFWRNRTAAYWERFHSRFDEMTGTDFQQVHAEFARIFAQAYKDKMRELGASR